MHWTLNSECKRGGDLRNESAHRMSGAGSRGLEEGLREGPETMDRFAAGLLPREMLVNPKVMFSLSLAHRDKNPGRRLIAVEEIFGEIRDWDGGSVCSP